MEGCKLARRNRDRHDVYLEVGLRQRIMPGTSLPEKTILSPVLTIRAPASFKDPLCASSGSSLRCLHFPWQLPWPLLPCSVPGSRSRTGTAHLLACPALARLRFSAFPCRTSPIAMESPSSGEPPSSEHCSGRTYSIEALSSWICSCISPCSSLPGSACAAVALRLPTRVLGARVKHSRIQRVSVHASRCSGPFSYVSYGVWCIRTPFCTPPEVTQCWSMLGLSPYR